MRRAPHVLLAAFICALLGGCAKGGPMKDITEVIYASTAGSILPELRWHEEFAITRGAVTLTRNGLDPETEINAGSWTFAADAAAVDALFAQLATVDCAKLKRVEPEDPTDGGPSERYTILYDRGKKCSLYYQGGNTYTGDEAVVASIDAFIRGLMLPAGAGRYK